MELSTRAAYRGQVTKIVKSALDFLKDDSSRVSEENEPNFDDLEEELVSHIQRLTSANDNLNAVNEDIKQKNLIKDDESQKCIEYQDQAINALSRLKLRLERLHKKTQLILSHDSPNTRPSTSSIGCKLPKLPLKRFDGKYSDWLPFWEQFRSAVHENTNLCAPEKFNYLESVLTGDAKKSISGFTPSEMCYEAAIGLLQERYGSTEKLIDNHIQQLVSLSSVRDRNDTPGLRNLYGTVVTCTRSLTALQVPTNHYYVMLKSILLRCLPTALRIEYHRQEESSASADDALENSSDNASGLSQVGGGEVKDILRFLKREIESLEKSGITHTSSKFKTVAQSTASSLVTVSATETACIFCKSSNHKTKDCDSNISIADKKQLLRSSGRCFRCARAGHSSKKCRSGKFLLCGKCKGRHMSSMCDPSWKNTSQESDSKNEYGALNLCAHSMTENVFLKTVRCAVVSNMKNISIRALIDGGSQHSFIRESLVNKLNLKSIGTVKLSVIPFGCTEAKPLQKFNKVKIILNNLLNHEMPVVLEAIVVPDICADVLTVPEAECPLFEGIQLSDVQDSHLETEEGLSLLIGSDFYWNVVTGKQRRLSKRLRAVETVFGWTLQGLHVAVSDKIVSAYKSSCFSSRCLINLTSVESNDLTQFWSLEAIGIRNNEDENNFLTENLIDKCIIKHGSRYTAKLPWKSYDSVLQDNKSHAMQRLNSLIRRLSRNPARLLEYDNAIRKLVSDGVAEPVTSMVLYEHSDQPRVFYLPHQPVYKEEGTTKLRVVFDASAHIDGTGSLNDHLWTGANLLPDVLKVLLNFRLGLHGIVADIEKAFLQISLCPEDRDSHRFIWFGSKLTSPSDRPKFNIYRMTRVTFGVNCSPFLLCATIKYHLQLEQKDFPTTCATLLNSIYMDDLVISTDDEQEGSEMCSQAVGILKRASMNLHKWNSSSQVIRSAMKVENAPAVQKVLGLSWFTYSDELSVPMESVLSLIGSESAKGTKRNVLQIIARIFDPIGILGPSIVKIKILFQKLWKQKLQWDEVLSGDLLTEWNDCVKGILELKDMAVSRAAVSIPLNEGTFQIHIFADASTKAYGTVAFVRSISPSGKIAVSFLCAKNRVAPLKMDGSSELTLPKLELTAALIAARLHSYLKGCLKLTSAEYFLWTDSKITLSWILGDVKRWQPYVQNRVEEIRRLTLVSQWAHCRGKENPADLLTRGVSGSVLQRSGLWVHGPSWLENSDDSWIHREAQAPEVTAILLTESVPSTSPIDQPLLCYNDYSSWTRLTRVTAFVFRSIKAFQRKMKPGAVLSINDVPPLCVTDIQQAENHWLRYVQGLNFSNEISLLQKGRAVQTTSKVFELSPFLDNNNIMRLGGRLQGLDEPMEVKHPIILPSHSHLLNLIIDDYHERTLHAGVNTVLTKLRRRFWIVRGRQAINKRIKKCLVCKKLWGPPASQPFAPLPIERISLSRPFDNVGVDFAGPLYCYDDNSDAAKVYIAIFTCAAVRAVHLEITRGLSTEHFLMALRRFIGRRGVPSTILSDNARTFRRAAMELRSHDCFLDEEVIQGFLSKRKIQWQFIVERAPWWGGFWERLIRTMKNLLKVTIGKAKLNFEQLRTLVIETEEIVNNRPLTYISADPLDLSPLTPADFLIESRGWNSETPTREPDADLLRDVWKSRMKFKTKLKRRWESEYLQLLRSFHNLPKNRSTQHLKAGDVVIVSDQTTPRINWKMAIVEQAFQGRDSKVRSCIIRLPDGKQLRRPIQLLYPLEVQPCPPEDVEN